MGHPNTQAHQEGQ